jgi:hypothetical protein
MEKRTRLMGESAFAMWIIGEECLMLIRLLAMHHDDAIVKGVSGDFFDTLAYLL